jgi:hypothetical protein
MLGAVFVVVGGVGASNTAQAIEGQRAVRHIKRYVEQDCYSYRGFRCVGWGVEHCFKLGQRKVRCKAHQEYIHNGNWRICLFRASAVERRDRHLVDLHFGYTRCYSESGDEIPARQALT